MKASVTSPPTVYYGECLDKHIGAHPEFHGRIWVGPCRPTFGQAQSDVLTHNRLLHPEIAKPDPTRKKDTQNA